MEERREECLHLGGGMGDEGKEMEEGGGKCPGNNVIVSVKEVTTGRVDYTVRYNVTGQVSLSVNIIAIGIPN